MDMEEVAECPVHPQKDSKGRRLSKTGTRSRSNTTASTSSSFESPASSMSSGVPSRQGSQEDRPSTSLSYHEERKSSTNSILSRGGRILKRQGSKFSLLTLSEEHADDASKRQEKYNEISTRSRSKSVSRHNIAVRKTISQPFDFHHIVHTNRKEVEVLQKVNQDEIRAQFMARRSPTELSPLSPNSRAVRSPFTNFIDSPNAKPVTSPETEISIASPSTPPKPQHPVRTSAIVSESGSGSRVSRSIENFSRPVPRSPVSPVSPKSPSDRASSIHAPSTISELSTADVDALLGLNVGMVGLKGFPESSVASQAPTGPVQFGHAVTTVDDSATVLRPSVAPYPTDLSTLTEEDESITTLLSDHKSTSRPSTSRSSLKHAQSTPAFSTSVDRTVGLGRSSQSIARETSHINFDPSPVPGTSFLDNRPRTSEADKRFSIGLKPINIDSWEDDIDYCYEHAAEADCDFDWDRRSTDGNTFSTSDHAKSKSAENKVQRLAPTLAQPPFLLSSRRSKSHMDVPDLEPASARTLSSWGEAHTPAMTVDDREPQPGYPFAATKESESQRPAVFIPEGDDVVDIYGDILPDTHDDNAFHLYSQMEQSLPTLSMSSRDCRSPISKYNSQESMMLSRAASIVHTHRSSNSAGSLPELIHSLSDADITRQSTTLLPRYPSASKLSHVSTPSITNDSLSQTADPKEPRNLIADEDRPESQECDITPTGTVPHGAPATCEETPTAIPEDSPFTFPKIAPPHPASSGHAPSHHHSVSEVLPMTPRSADPTGPSFAARMRANSAVASKVLPRKPSARTSYSLFPTGSGMRSPPPPVVSPVGNFF